MQALAQAAVAGGPEQTRGGLHGPNVLDVTLDRVGARNGGELLDEALGVRGQQRRKLVGALRPDVGDRIGFVEESERRDEHETAREARRERCRFGRERSAHRRPDELGAAQLCCFEQIERRRHPVREIVELLVPARAREAGQRWHHDAARAGEAL